MIKVLVRDRENQSIKMEFDDDEREGFWSNIGTNFDPDEETANFGTRHAIEASGKLFDVFTLATVSPSGKIFNDPCLISRSRKNPDKLALVLDKYAHIFTHDLQEVYSVEFTSLVDVLEWTPNENFIICGLRSGKIQFVHLPSRRPLPPLNSRLLPKQEGKAFAGIAVHEDATFSVFSCAGKV